jgi:CheY-like chemotaxis protein
MSHVHSALVVEDDTWMREAMVEALTAGGHQARGARDGAEALRRLAEDGPFCLVFLDLAMPGMDGRAFMDQLRRSPDPGWPPVVIVSAYCTRDEAHSLGATDLLKKPFTFDRLPELIAQHCRTQ